MEWLVIDHPTHPKAPFQHATIHPPPRRTKMFDQDRNARISADEITRVIGEMGDDLQGSEVQHIISAMGRADIDGNRQISFPEFAKMMIEAAEEEL